MFFAMFAQAAYKVAPIWVGQHALNTFLKQHGVPAGFVPTRCRREIARDALSASIMLTMGQGTGARVAEYTHCLEARAFQVFALFSMADRASPILQTAWKTRTILEAHGISPPS